MLSGLESGGINVQSVRHDEGKIITCLRKHTSAVSILTLSSDEKSLLSGSWDKAVYDWDLNTGQVVREYVGSAGQISTVQFRPILENTIAIPKQSTLPNGISGGRGLANGIIGRHTNGINGNSDSDGGVAQAASPAESEHSLVSLFGEDGDDEFGAAVTANGMNNENENGTPPDESMGDTTVEESSGFQASIESEMHVDGDELAPTNGLDIDMSDTNALFGDDTLTNPLDPHIPTPAANGNYPCSPSPHANDDITTSTTNNSNNHNTTINNYHDQDPSPPSPSSPSSSSGPVTYTNTFLTSSIDGTLRIWDRRMSSPVAVALPQKGVPPWCTSAVWSTDGNFIYAGRRNCTVEEYSIHKGFMEPSRVLKFPQGSGPVSAIARMPNGRHLLWWEFFISISIPSMDVC